MFSLYETRELSYTCTLLIIQFDSFDSFAQADGYKTNRECIRTVYRFRTKFEPVRAIGAAQNTRENLFAIGMPSVYQCWTLY
jgi:hypothetical protein